MLPATASSDALRYIAPKDQEFLEAFFDWYCRRFPVTQQLNLKHVKDQTHLTVMSFPKVRDFTTLATLNHAMLADFYVDDHRHRLDLVRLLDDSSADPVVHAFKEYIRSEIPDAHEGYTDVFREFLAGNLLQGKVKRSELLYSRVKSVTMGIMPVHYVRWCLYGLPAEKFGALKLHNYMRWLELDTVLVNDRYSLDKESDSREWNAIAAHELSHEELTAMIDENYAHLITALGELLATEEDQTYVEAYEDFKICADATKTWEEFSPRYHNAQSSTETDGPGSNQSARRRVPHGPTGIGTKGLRLGINSAGQDPPNHAADKGCDERIGGVVVGCRPCARFRSEGAPSGVFLPPWALGGAALTVTGTVQAADNPPGSEAESRRGVPLTHFVDGITSHRDREETAHRPGPGRTRTA